VFRDVGYLLAKMNSILRSGHNAYIHTYIRMHTVRKRLLTLV